MGILDRIQKPSELSYSNVTVIMGPIGSGKTTIASSYPKPILFVSVADKVETDKNGDDVLIGDSGEQVLIELEGEGIDVLRVKNGYEAIEVIKDLKATNDTHYKTIVLDAISTIEDEMAMTIARRKNTKNKESGGGLSFDDWNNIKAQIYPVYEAYENYSLRPDTEVVIISHVKDMEKTSKTTGDKYTKTIPNLTQSNGTRLTKDAKNVWYVEQVSVDGVEGVYRTTLAGHPFMDLKTRTNGAKINSKYIDDLTYDKYIDFITGLNDPSKKKKTGLFD